VVPSLYLLISKVTSRGRARHAAAEASPAEADSETCEKALASA
jgi:hypothetical protein